MRRRPSNRSPIILLAFALLFLIFTHRGVAIASELQLNEKGYFETRGFNVLIFENEYTGMFFDEKTSGVLLIHHGNRTATGGSVRLKPTPEQWDQIPKVMSRAVNEKENRIDVELRYEDFNFNSRLSVRPEGNGFLMSVFLDKPLPEKLIDRTGLNIEFLPSTYFEKSYVIDGVPGNFPLHPASSMEVKPESTQIRQYADHATYDDRGRDEYVEPKPVAVGKKIILAPEDPATRIEIECKTGNLMLLDGRNVAQNGWFVIRTLLPANQTGKVAEFLITPTLIPDWIRTPVIGHSQVGYLPDQPKTAVIELDKNDTPLKSASLLKLNNEGEWETAFSGDVVVWGDYLRYNYAKFDFSQVKEPGLYLIQYGRQKTGPFGIGSEVYNTVWHPTLDIWFPVQMDHMFVNEAYRVWHGRAHMDDALQAPLNHQHFDGYRMGDTTETQYKPGERIPGLNIGGWFDAGDFDIRTGSHCMTVESLVDSWEHFKVTRDETLVDREQGYVDIHHPDQVPDIQQQIEQGALALLAQHRAFGRAIPGIIVPHLHQYHHLGDAVNMTDNLPYNPNLKPYETDGLSSGTMDDRWAFTQKSARSNYSSITALAAASRALRGYNEKLADECIQTAIVGWEYQHQQPTETHNNRFRFSGSEDLEAALELYITTKDEMYAEKFNSSLWAAMAKNAQFSMRYAIRALPYMDASFKEKLRPYVLSQKAIQDSLASENPYGMPISTRGWAGNHSIIMWGINNYLLHEAFPDIIGPENTYRALDYIFGCHPCSNISFVTGVGRYSKRMAYGNNRADFSFIAGGVVPGVLVLKPDFPEHMIDWPFLWGENECVIDICAQYIFLANAVDHLSKSN